MFDYTAPEGLLSGRTILITGANRGIGAAAAEAFAVHGASTVLLGRTPVGLKAIADRIERLGRPRPATITFDLQGTSDERCATLVDTLQAAGIRQLDGLLHNASLLGPRQTVENTSTVDFAQVMDVNVTAVFALTRALLPLLKRSEEASMILTSSSVGRQGRAQWGSYAISKFATEGLMQVLADELRDTRIRVNSVNPGGTRTAMRAAAYPDENPRTRPSPEAIMPVYLYLMGPASRGVSGQALNAQ